MFIIFEIENAMAMHMSTTVSRSVEGEFHCPTPVSGIFSIIRSLEGWNLYLYVCLQMYLYYFYMKTAFPSNTFIGQLVLGSRETVKKVLNKNVYADALFKIWIFK